MEFTKTGAIITGTLIAAAGIGGGFYVARKKRTPNTTCSDEGKNTSEDGVTIVKEVTLHKTPGKEPAAETDPGLTFEKVSDADPALANAILEKIAETLKDMQYDQNLALAARADIEKDLLDVRDKMIAKFLNQVNELDSNKKSIVAFEHFTEGDLYERLVEFCGARVVHIND